MYFQPEDNRETTIDKREKVEKNKYELKMTFLLNFLRLSEEVEMLGKTVEQVVIPCNFKRYKRTHTILEYWFTDSLFSLAYPSIDR